MYSSLWNIYFAPPFFFVDYSSVLRTILLVKNSSKFTLDSVGFLFFFSPLFLFYFVWECSSVKNFPEIRREILCFFFSFLSQIPKKRSFCVRFFRIYLTPLRSSLDHSRLDCGSPKMKKLDRNLKENFLLASAWFLGRTCCWIIGNSFCSPAVEMTIEMSRSRWKKDRSRVEIYLGSTGIRFNRGSSRFP